MKKVLSIFLILILAITPILPVFAAEHEYVISGPGLVVLPADNDTERMYVVDYALYDKTDEQNVDAKFSVSGSDIIMTADGQLITSSDDMPGSATISAVYEGKTYTKTVNLKKGTYIDFENETAGSKPTNWVNRDVEIATESDDGVENKYLDTLATYARYDFPSGDLAGDSTTLEWDVKFTITNNTINKSSLMALTHNWADAEHSSGAYYYNIYARVSDGKVELYRQNGADGTSISWPYTDGVLGQFDSNAWINMRLVLNHVDKTYSIYINNEPKALDWRMESSIKYATLVGMMPYGYVDNVRAYTGIPGEYQVSTAAQSVVLPLKGKTSAIDLGMNITVGDTTYENITTSWELKNPYTGVSVNGNVLTVTDEAAAGEVILVPTDDRFDCEKTVTIYEPTIYLYSADKGIEINAEPNRAYTVIVFGPKGAGNDIAEKFIEAYTIDDQVLPVIIHSVMTDDNGIANYSMEGCDAGLYNIYVKGSDNTLVEKNEVAHIAYDNKISDLMTDSAAMESEKFLELLIKRNINEAASAYNVYNELDDKDFVIELADGKTDNFSVASLMAGVLAESYANTQLCISLKNALVSLGYNTDSIDLLCKTNAYTELVQNVLSSGKNTIDGILDEIFEQAIITGIKNADTDNEAMEYIAYLGSSKYDSARESQKEFIAKNLRGNTYDSTDDIKSAISSIDLSLVEIDYQIKGNSKLALPMKPGDMSIIQYTLYDTELATPVNAEFSFAQGDTTGLYLSKDGKLVTSGGANVGNITINAKYEGKIYSKEIALKQGFYEDFENSTAGEKPIGWVNREVIVASDADGNKYLNSLDDYARYNFADDLASESVSVEYDVKYTVINDKINRTYATSFTHGWTNRAESKGRYYLGLDAALNSAKTAVELSRAYNSEGTASATLLTSVPLDRWVHVKYVFDFSEKTYDVYIEDSKVAQGWKMDSDITEATFVGLIPYGNTDNFNVYSGNAGAYTAQAPDLSAALPRNGKTAALSLGMNLTVNDITAENIAIDWELKNPYSGVSVAGNVLTVSDTAAAGTVELVSANDEFDITKTVTLFEPTILIDTEGSDLLIDGKANREYDVHIYKPGKGSLVVDSFVSPTTPETDSAEFISICLTTDSNGKAVYNLSSLDEGVYNIYVTESSSSSEETASLQYVSKLSVLMNDVPSVSSDKFADFLTVNDVDYNDATASVEIYKTLSDKSDVASLMGDDITVFPEAVSLCAVLSGSSYNRTAGEFLIQYLTKHDKDSSAIELLRKNTSYTAVTNATKAQGITDVQTVLSNLKTNAILLGIQNVANKRDANTFLAYAGSDKYDKASTGDKNIIAEAVAKRSFATIGDLIDAIDNVKLGSGGSQGSGGGPSSVSTSSGSGTGLGAPAVSNPVVPSAPASVFNDVSADHWAKNAIEILNEKGIISGYDGSFRPEDTLTRAEMAKIITIAAGLTDGESSFSDVCADDWFYTYVSAAAGAKLVNGYEGRFNPNFNITRQDVAVILYRLFGDKLESASDLNFTDSIDVADYAADAVAALSKEGIINGYADGSFKPSNPITRAEIAKLMVNCITLWEGDSNE